MMEKTLDYYMNLPYTIELQRDPEEGWFVSARELRGCMSQGDTAEEAVAMIQDAMLAWLEIALEDGLPIPEPRPEEDYSGKFVVRVPCSLHRDLVENARREGVSLNQYVNVALARTVGQATMPSSVLDEEPGWPGLKAVVQRVLTAAGFTQEAGELDERLFGHWADQCLGQVESALQGGYTRDALWCLETLGQGLRVGASKSPVVASFHRTVSLLSQQIDMVAKIQQGVTLDLMVRSKIALAVQGSNQLLAQAAIREERVAYSETSAERARSRQYVGQLLGQPSYPSEW